MVQRCKEWLTWDWDVNLPYTFKEANRATYQLEKSAISLQTQGKKLQNPLEKLFDIIQLDAYGSLR